MECDAGGIDFRDVNQNALGFRYLITKKKYDL